ncbi:MAG: TonB-dependent receptor [Bacteroidaceae bacterium]|nr:TonB-dependent receptor [Bacteroidaceae bacterium]
MFKHSTLIAGLLLLSSAVVAQTDKKTTAKTNDVEEEQKATQTEGSFTFTEAQLGEDEDASQNVTIISSNTDLYASEVGYGFSAVRFRYRALNQKYNDVYVNGMQLNDMETGQFRFALVGGLNNQTRSVESVLPFESNNFAPSNLAGANNYNFRAVSMPSGHKASLLLANRNYNLRAMYTYGTGILPSGWSFSANVTYRGATYGTQKINKYYKGTFYNALSYYLGASKIINDNHTISFATWGNPTERASQGASTDEMYWIDNSHYYNSYWGYQNGNIRASRIITDYAPSAIFTWDWKIKENMKLVTTLGGRYSMYKNTSLDYNNADNPSPDYWKNMPSAYYNVWDPSNVRNNDYTISEWQATYDYLTADVANRQINWDRLYAANKGCNDQGLEAMYFVKAKHNNALNLQLNSVFNAELNNNIHFNAGLGVGTNSGRHFMTVDDLLGANKFYNTNTFAVSTYGLGADQIQYDLDNKGKLLQEGDKYRYDYFINVTKATLWGSYSHKINWLHILFGAKTNVVAMQREGMMRNGMAKDNSLGKSGTARFLDGGVKLSLSMNLGRGNTISLGAGAEKRAPQASTAFAAPEVNNDFVKNLHNERVFSSELRYQLRSSWVNLNINAYYNIMDNVTEWQNYYFDDNNSFTYVSLTNIKKASYGVELGARFKLTSFLDLKAFGTISDAKYLNDCNARYMVSKRAEYVDTKVYSKDMRESGTPLTAAALGLSFHSNGWFIDLYGKYYDRIYLSWSPSLRYESVVPKRQSAGDVMYDNEGNLMRSAFEQAQGKGGFMLDASVGRSIYLKRGSLSINLSINNILNNQNIVTGGYEQSRTDYTKNNSGGYDKRIYIFSKNPKKFYALGTNGMLNITYKF